MSSADPQAVALLAGVELLTAVLLAWRGPDAGPRGLLALQGFALAGLVAVLGLAEGDAVVLAVAAGVALLKGVVLPALVARGGGGAGGARRARASTLLVGSAALVVLAYVVARPLVALVPGPSGQALPVGFALVLVGFALLATGTRSRSQLVGFLVLDNGIATTAFLATGGVPLVVELGVSLDVLLVVLVLQVLGTRVDAAFADGGAADLDQLRELHD
jgi:hydrogenase-4 component E